MRARELPSYSFRRTAGTTARSYRSGNLATEDRRDRPRWYARPWSARKCAYESWGWPKSSIPKGGALV